MPKRHVKLNINNFQTRKEVVDGATEKAQDL